MKRQDGHYNINYNGKRTSIKLDYGTRYLIGVLYTLDIEDNKAMREQIQLILDNTEYKDDGAKKVLNMVVSVEAANKIRLLTPKLID